jgi:membrane protein implicated in regulation of membrane protease activity
MILAILILCVVLLLAVSALAYYTYRRNRSQELQISYIIDRTEDLQGKLGTVGKVLKIFEDETQILQRRNAQQQELKQRFNRQPR